MLFTKVSNNIGSGVRLVAENLTARLLLKLLNDLLWKTIRVGWELLWRNDACHLPVTNRSIFTSGFLLHASICTLGRLNWLQINVIHGIKRAINIKKAQLCHIWDIKNATCCAGTKGITTLVSVCRCIRLFADAKTIKNNYKNTFRHATS